MKLILCGACGKMGRAVAELAKERGDEVVCGVDTCGADLPFPLYPDCNKITETADALVDFSSPSGLEKRLEFCATRGLPAVLGVTGYSDADLALIAQNSQRLAVFQTGNFSVGIYVLQSLVKKTARVLGEEFDVEIVERHHNQKKDAPSGTALMLAKSANEGFGGDKQNVYGRQGAAGPRDKREIGIHAVRGGNLMGEHEVMFAGEDEILTLSHSARSRRVFASGALRAAHFLMEKPAGLYGMDDLLGGLLD